MPTLDGTERPVELAPGVRVTAPGLRGEAVAVDVGPASPTRASRVDASRPEWDTALASSGVTRTRVITLDVSEAPLPGTSSVRAPSGEDGLVVEIPDLGESVGQVIVAIDEGGVITWNFPVDPGGRLAPETRGAGDSLRFLIRNTTPSPDEQGAQRGLLGMAGRKILEVLVFPLVEPVLGEITHGFAGRWETVNRPVRVRTFLPGEHRSGDAAPIERQTWEALGRGPSLWFVHGTFSTSQGGFGALPAETLRALHDRYDGRVVAFDHHSLSVDPLENVAALAELVPDGVSITADVVGHSRGGLVARALAGEGGAGSPLTVRKAVYVGTPNHGTPLADPRHMVAFVDRISTMLNLVPDPTAVSDVIEAVLVVVKMIARVGLSALPGLASMDPVGSFLGEFNRGEDTGVVHHAIAADYEPEGALRRLVAQKAKDALVDRVFQDAANDLVVPTSGVFEGSSDVAFPIPDDRRLVFAPADAVFHGGFFSRPETSQALLRWL